VIAHCEDIVTLVGRILNSVGLTVDVQVTDALASNRELAVADTVDVQAIVDETSLTMFAAAVTDEVQAIAADTSRITIALAVTLEVAPIETLASTNGDDASSANGPAANGAKPSIVYPYSVTKSQAVSSSFHVYVLPSSGIATGAVHWQVSSTKTQLSKGFGGMKASRS